MQPVLSLYEDIYSNGAALPLGAHPRMIFVVHGSVTVESATLSDGETWHGERDATVVAGANGACCWRYELTDGDRRGAANPAAGVETRVKVVAPLTTLPAGDLLLRGDSVAFPPGGCAYLHRHQGPGIRCLMEGAIRIDTHGHSTCYGPGGAWFESGPDSVFAQAAADRPSRFIRVMVLPRALLGKSSIQLLNEADKSKPRDQQYKIFADAPIAFRLPG